MGVAGTLGQRPADRGWLWGWPRHPAAGAPSGSYRRAAALPAVRLPHRRAIVLPRAKRPPPRRGCGRGSTALWRCPIAPAPLRARAPRRSATARGGTRARRARLRLTSSPAGARPWRPPGLAGGPCRPARSARRWCPSWSGDGPAGAPGGRQGRRGASARRAPGGRSLAWRLVPRSRTVIRPQVLLRSTCFPSAAIALGRSPQPEDRAPRSAGSIAPPRRRGEDKMAAWRLSAVSVSRLHAAKHLPRRCLQV